MSQTLTPLLYDESLNDWFAADCQIRTGWIPPCGKPAVVHRPNRAIVRQVCAEHATPDEIAERVAREVQCPPYDAQPRVTLPTERS